MRPAPTALALALTLAACGDEPAPADTSDTAGDSTDTRDTTDGTDTADTQDTREVGDGSLTGTRLASTTVTWDQPLTLCSTWYEGASLASELAHKVRVTLNPSPRTALDGQALASATLSSLRVETSPLAAGQHHLDASATTSSLVDWQLRTQATWDMVTATITHSISALGTLEERYAVVRDDNANPPIIVTAGATDVTFWWLPAGQAEAHLLGPCDAPADWELAAELIGFSQGDLAGTLLRFYRTPYRDISAGSYPFHFEAATLTLSDRPFEATTVRGFWTHTYAAEHHNWNDQSRLDFALDLGQHYLTFAPLARGETIRQDSISTVEYLDVQGNSPGSIRITFLAADGTPSSKTFTIDAGPRRVDAAHLARQLTQHCQTPTVGLVGYGDHVAQLAFCPSASAPQGQALVAVVPVVWRLAPASVGTPLEGAAITALSGRPGWIVAIGPSRLVVEPRPDGFFIIDILDAQDDSIAQMYTELMPLIPDAGWQDPVQAASTDSAVTLSIERTWVAQGVGHSAIYASPRFALSWGDRHDVVDAWDAIDYTNTHHNWQDEASATTHDGLVLHWKVSYDVFAGDGLEHEVWVTDADGATLLDKTPVIPLPVPR